MSAVPASMLLQMPMICQRIWFARTTSGTVYFAHLAGHVTPWNELYARCVWQTGSGLQGFLSDGLSYEPRRHVGWYNLGLLHKAQHRPEEAERCLRTAVGLSLTAPVMSFSKLPRLLWQCLSLHEYGGWAWQAQMIRGHGSLVLLGPFCNTSMILPCYNSWCPLFLICCRCICNVEHT